VLDTLASAVTWPASGSEGSSGLASARPVAIGGLLIASAAPESPLVPMPFDFESSSDRQTPSTHVWPGGHLPSLQLNAVPARSALQPAAATHTANATRTRRLER
jgi:hypothetical protein